MELTQLAAVLDLPFPQVADQRPANRPTGQSVGSVKLQDGKLLLSLSWDDPHGGSGLDTYSLVSEDTLHVHCTYSVAGESAAYTHVYQRKR